MDTLDLLTHPVRLRIVHALSAGRVLTAGDLRERLGDVPKASLYRHLAVLASNGILEVDSEHRVRGAVERHYRLNTAAAVIDADAAASASIADHRRAFAAATAALIAEFNGYLDRPDTDPAADLVGYRQHTIWLSPAERAELIEELREVIARRINATPSASRQRHLLSPILFPVSDGDSALSSTAKKRVRHIDAMTKPGIAPGISGRSTVPPPPSG